MADPDIPFGGGGGHEMRLNAKVTVRSFGGQTFIYNKITTSRSASKIQNAVIMDRMVTGVVEKPISGAHTEHTKVSNT